MLLSEIYDAQILARDFLQKADICIEETERLGELEDRGTYRTVDGLKVNSALKRVSLDLTRALSSMRNETKYIHPTKKS